MSDQFQGVLMQGCICFMGDDGGRYEIPVSSGAVAMFPFPSDDALRSIKVGIESGKRFTVRTFWRDKNSLIQSRVIDATGFVQKVV